MTILAHWVLDDTNTGAKTCASRHAISRTLSLSNVSTVTKRDTHIPDSKGGDTTRNVLGIASLSTGGSTGLIASQSSAHYLAAGDRVVFDLLVRLVDGVSFVAQLRDTETTDNDLRWTIDFTGGVLTVLPQQFISGTSNDVDEHVIRAIDLGVVANKGDLALITLEVDTDTDFATPLFTTYLNGEMVGRSHAVDALDASFDEGADAGGGLEEFRILNASSSTLNFLVEIMVTDTAVTLGDVRRRARFTRWMRDVETLPILAPLASTSLHLVANDYVEGAASWVDRSGAGNNATAVGAANLTTSYSSHFLTRQAVKGAASSGFYAPGDVLTGATERTYEVVIEDYGPSGDEMILGRLSAGATQHSFWLYKNSNEGVLSAVWPSDGFGTGFDHIHMGGGYFDESDDDPWDLPVIFHIVVDAPNQAIQVWRNGVLMDQESDPQAGSLGSLATPNLGILGKFSTTSNTFDSGEFFTGKLLELARHEELFTPAMIAARCAVFNALKGY